MKEIAKSIANTLLQIKAIKLDPANHFVWASGWNSPIYCDNRKTLSYPAARTAIRDAFVDLIKEKYPETEVVAGVATGAVAIGALVADKMGLPFVYIRAKPKGHGLENLIEGEIKAGQKVVVVEDLISTGGSSLKAVEALRASKCEVQGMVAIFTYGFQKAVDSFSAAYCNLFTLSNYNALIDAATESGYVSSEDVETLKEWRKDPGSWKK